jgi:hypothetical protein
MSETEADFLFHADLMTEHYTTVLLSQNYLSL